MIRTACAALLMVLVTLSTFADESPGRILDRLLALERATPTLPAPDGDALTTAHAYLFEELQALDAQDFLDAITHLTKNYPPPRDNTRRPAYEAGMTQRLRLLLEYYPLAARQARDTERLLDMACDMGVPPWVRVYIIRQAGPGLEAMSAFGNYLQGYLNLAGDSFEVRLRELVQMPQENRAVQCAALDTLLARVEADYAALLARDGQAAQYVAEHGAVHARMLRTSGDAIPLTNRTKLLLETQNESVGKWARSLRELGDNAQRDATVRGKARAVLDVLEHDYPIGGTK